MEGKGGSIMSAMAKPEFAQAMQQMGQGVNQMSNYWRGPNDQLKIRPNNALKQQLMQAQLTGMQDKRKQAESAALRDKQMRAGLTAPTQQYGATDITQSPIGGLDEAAGGYGVGSPELAGSVEQGPSLFQSRTGLPDSMAQNMSQGGLEKLMTRKGPEGFSLTPGARRYDAQGNEIAATPATPDKGTSLLQNYTTAVGQGYKGSIFDYQKQLKQAGAPKSYGTISPGYQMTTDPVTGAVSQSVIPGSPQDIKAKASAATEATRVESKAASSAAKANTMLSSISGIRKEMQDSGMFGATGTMSQIPAQLSNTAAGRVRSHVRTLKSGVVLGAMMELKAQSKAGATGFGAMNEAELDILIASLGALEPNTTDPDIFMSTIDRIEGQYNRVIENVRQTVPADRLKALGLGHLLETGKGFGKKKTRSDARRKKYGLE